MFKFLVVCTFIAVISGKASVNEGTTPVAAPADAPTVNEPKVEESPVQQVLKTSEPQSDTKEIVNVDLTKATEVQEDKFAARPLWLWLAFTTTTTTTTTTTAPMTPAMMMGGMMVQVEVMA